MSKINMNLDAFPPYMRTLVNICNSFCAEQSSIDYAYNMVQESWSDKNCVYTGIKLRETGNDIATFYGCMTEAAAKAKEYYNRNAEIIDISPISMPTAEEFRIRLQEKGNMSDNRITTDPEALKSFKRALDAYINTICNNVNRLISTHSSMRYDWDDSHYDRFGEALDNFKVKMGREVNDFIVISEFLRRKIEKYDASAGT